MRIPAAVTVARVSAAGRVFGCQTVRPAEAPAAGADGRPKPK